MADYWISLPKHFCEYCKVWCQGDPASVKHHESGKKHKETVQRYFFDRKKAKIDEDKRQREIDKELRDMDKVRTSSPCVMRFFLFRSPCFSYVIRID